MRNKSERNRNVEKTMKEVTDKNFIESKMFEKNKIEQQFGFQLKELIKTETCLSIGKSTTTAARFVCKLLRQVVD